MKVLVTGGAGFIGSHMGERFPMFGDGRSERDYTYITDILDGMEGALGLLSREPEIYDVVNLGGARTISLRDSLRDMIDQVAVAMDVQPRISRLPAQAGDVRRTYADVSKAKRLRGYRPSMPFTEGLRRFAEWYRAEHLEVRPSRRRIPTVPHTVANAR